MAKKATATKSVVAEETATGKKTASAKKGVSLLTAGIIGDHLAETFEIPKSHAKAYMDEIVDQIGKNLRKGGKVQIAHLGVFQVKKRAARKGRNPSTGEAIKIKATKRVAFTASQDLKAKL